MKFDTIIIGGGLSGLTTGIKLAEQGRKCAIISSGQSALHFFCGSFDLLGSIDGQEVSNPIESMELLPGKHPYSRIGLDNILRLVDEVPQFLQRGGLNLSGNAYQNHYVLTPMGTMKPTWLTLNDFSMFEDQNKISWEKAVIFNFDGFLDFHTLFVKDGLSRLGVQADIESIAMKQFETIRRNPSEMRSTNIAKVLDKGDALKELVIKINRLSGDNEVVILPAVFGLFNKDVVSELKSEIKKTVVLLPVVPPSVPGIRSQILLRNRFQHLGGTYFLGDNIEKGIFGGNRLLSVNSTNHGDIKLEADHFVLASGSFYSKGLMATPHEIYEPIFGLDIDAEKDRSRWVDEQFFNEQPFMSYGVKINDRFCALKNNQSIDNLYVAGSILSGANPLKEGCGAGISLLSSLHVAERILKERV